MSRFFIIPAILIIIWSNVLFLSDPVNPDAQFIMNYLNDLAGIGSYFSDLIQFKTIDIQPLRDLSLYFDLIVFRLTTFNIIILHNFIIWCLCLWVLYKILNQYQTTNHPILYLALLATHPIVSNVVPWGMARKHLLALLFILIATYQARKKDEQQKRLVILISYLFSVLSQPINVLWPIWYKLKTKHNFKLLFFVSFALLFLNYFYYSQSQTMYHLFGNKFSESINLSDLTLATGHYFFQIYFPYLLSLNYTLGHWSSFIGILLFVLTVFTFYKRKNYTWLIYIFLPLIIILRKTTTLYDTYLLTTLCGLIIFLYSRFQINKFIILFLIIINSIYSFNYTNHWENDVRLSEISFINRPSCISATDYLIAQYSSEKISSDKTALNFILNFNCFHSKHIQRINLLQSYILFYENIFEINKRENLLLNLKPQTFISQVAITGFYIKKGDVPQTTKYLEKLIDNFEKLKIKGEYEPIIKNVVYPYCLNNKNYRCMKLFKDFLKRKDGIFYH